MVEDRRSPGPGSPDPHEGPVFGAVPKVKVASPVSFRTTEA